MNWQLSIVNYQQFTGALFLANFCNVTLLLFVSILPLIFEINLILTSLLNTTIFVRNKIEYGLLLTFDVTTIFFLFSGIFLGDHIDDVTSAV